MASPDTSRLNETFDLLAHLHRRYVLYYLTNESKTVDIDTIAAALAKWDGNHMRTDRSTKSTDIEAALHHTHLPKLADAGIITLGANMDHVELRESEGLDQFLVEIAPIDDYPQVATDD